ncbi:hypothetical protein KIPB_003087 [Kipferlia bialata]|uniref:Uncharacterized protein n=1 Tax=Kipferlia bialata TaxID=797122 RepID=A0A9K3GGX8_9EUKA|nr:hypothetical protein KIPB_003087 [Kipferlia bialata]|eukprot:g3087.t1
MVPSSTLGCVTIPASHLSFSTLPVVSASGDLAVPFGVCRDAVPEPCESHPQGRGDHTQAGCAGSHCGERAYV